MQTVQTTCGEDVRSFTLDSRSHHFQQLVDNLCTAYGVPAKALIITFLDDEGDVCQLSSQPELEEAFRLCEEQPLQLNVAFTAGTVVQRSSAPPAAAAEPQEQQKQEPELRPPLQPSARFQCDVTVQDGEVRTSGEIITKVWRLTNDGAEPWPAGCTLTYAQGEITPLAGEDSPIAVPETLPGQAADIVAELMVPPRPGRFRGEYQLLDPFMRPFLHHGRIWVDVRVLLLPAAVKKVVKIAHSAAASLRGSTKRKKSSGASAEPIDEVQMQAVDVEVLPVPQPPSQPKSADIAAPQQEPEAAPDVVAPPPHTVEDCCDEEEDEDDVDLHTALQGTIAQVGESFGKIVAGLSPAAGDNASEDVMRVALMRARYVLEVAKTLEAPGAEREPEAENEAGVVSQDAVDVDADVDERKQDDEEPAAKHEAPGFFNNLFGAFTRSAEPEQEPEVVTPEPEVEVEPVAAAPTPEQQQQQQQQPPKKQPQPPKKPKVAPDARFTRDVTLPDGAMAVVGERVTKTWEFANRGEEAWPLGTSFQHVGGLLMPAVPAVALPAEQLCVPGQTVQLSVHITPQAVQECRQQGFYQLVTPEGLRFGTRVWVDLQLIQPPAPVPEELVEAQEIAATESDSENDACLDWEVVESEQEKVQEVEAEQEEGKHEMMDEDEQEEVEAPVVHVEEQQQEEAEQVHVEEQQHEEAEQVHVEEQQHEEAEQEPQQVVVAEPVVSPQAPAPSPPMAVPVAAAPVVAPAAEPYARQLAELNAMGFDDREMLTDLLRAGNGDVQRVANWLVNQQ